MIDRKKDIVDKAVEHLKRATGFETTIHIYDHLPKPDTILEIKNTEYKVEFNVEVKLFLNKARLALAINQLKKMRGIPLLITSYINPELMKTIENNEVNFIDATGNALIKVPPLFVKIKGNKIEQIGKIKTNKGTFNAAALKVIFTYLCNPGIEKKTIREIAEQANTAVGTAHKMLKMLIHGKGNMLVKKEYLLNEWVTLYPEKLKPKYLVGRYEIQKEMIDDIRIQDYGALWGGEEAAARLTNYLHPFIYTVYIGERQGEFILRNRLRKDPKGNLIIMNKFWNFENNDYPDITHPILIYADLLATGDPRNIETAKIIYEKDIVRYIKEY